LVTKLKLYVRKRIRGAKQRGWEGMRRGGGDKRREEAKDQEEGNKEDGKG
jgi:hypothetical protein